MKAARWYSPKDIRVEEVEEPNVKNDGVKVKVKWCGICGSDLHEYLAGPIFIPVGKPHPLTGDVAPVILGHEFSGEVVEIGKDVTNVKVGDRVVVEPMNVCGKCPACLEGKYNLCSSLGFHGLAGGGGGFSEYTTFTSRFVHKIPDSLSYEKAALIEPMSVALHSLRVGHFEVGQTAVVAGAGPIGLGTIECLKAAGAKQVVVVQRKSVRQEYALRAGADVLLDPNVVDVAAELRKLTGGAGADIAFETTGSEQCYNLLLDGLRFAGTMVVTSIWEGAIQYNPNSVVLTEKNIVGSICYCNDFPATIAMMADGRIKADGFITKRIALDDIVTEGFETLTGPEKKAQVKIIVTPDASLL
ncbi:2,3-butanediol dehydrogenase [Ethanoligenens sp.]|uniref:2,3-butanediol dehydrogenase n=1 Tax=Ethanoligenens sp. TaxID=2099655 RepID=UPI0039E907EB